VIGWNAKRIGVAVLFFSFRFELFFGFVIFGFFFHFNFDFFGIFSNIFSSLSFLAF